MSILDWNRQNDGVLHGTYNGLLYAIIKYPDSQRPLVQFKGLKTSDLHSSGWHSAGDLPTARRVCDAMMSAHGIKPAITS